MNERSGAKSKVVLLLVSALLQTITMISIMLAGIQQTFPNKSTATVQMIYSIAVGGGIVGTLFAGKAASFMTKKKYLLICLALNLVGGAIGFTMHNVFAMLAVASALVGIGTGSLPTLTAAIMAEYFEGEARAKILSYQGIAVALGGIAFSALAGVCAKIGWYGVYLIYFSNVIMFVLTLLLLPDGELEISDKSEKESILNRHILLLLAMLAFMALAYNTFGNNISFLITELHLGDTSTTGFVTSVLMGGMIVGSVAEPYCYRALKKFTSTLDITLMACGLLICATASSLSMIYIGSLVIGVGFGMYSPCIYSFMPEWSKPGMITMTMAIYAIVDKVVTMLNPVFVTKTAVLIGEGTQPRFMLAVMIAAIGIVISFVGMKTIGKD
ncbi:MAG: MFS transporter [Syntrophomonadaceae bacterium]|jgi:MFS family permease